MQLQRLYTQARLENPHRKQIWILHCKSGVLPVISERMNYNATDCSQSGTDPSWICDFLGQKIEKKYLHSQLLIFTFDDLYIIGQRAGCYIPEALNRKKRESG